MSQSDESVGVVIGVVAVATVVCGVVAIVVAIVRAIMAYTDPYPGVVFLVPLAALFAVGYGTAYLLDHRLGRRLGVAAFAGVAGSAVFLWMLNVIAGDAEVLWNAGALLTVLGFFSVFAVVPTVGLCFCVSLLFADLRAALMGETLVDLTKLPAELLAPIEAYLDNLTQHPPWRRFSLPWLIGRRESYRISQGELRGLFEQACAVLAEHERVCRQAIASVEARTARDAAQAREAFLATLPDDDRGLLEAQLRATADADGQMTRLTRENATLAHKLGQVSKERDELKSQLQGWVLYLRNHSDGSAREVRAIHTLLTVGDRWVRDTEVGSDKRNRRGRNAT